VYGATDIIRRPARPDIRSTSTVHPSILIGMTLAIGFAMLLALISRFRRANRDRRRDRIMRLDAAMAHSPDISLNGRRDDDRCWVKFISLARCRQKSHRSDVDRALLWSKPRRSKQSSPNTIGSSSVRSPTRTVAGSRKTAGDCPLSGYSHA